MIYEDLHQEQLSNISTASCWILPFTYRGLLPPTTGSVSSETDQV